MVQLDNDRTGVTESQQPAQKMHWLYVFIIGLGFFTTGVSWSVYNSYLPADFLPAFITGGLQNTIIGAVMVLDNVLALFMQPYIGARSDRVRTRIGRRMPFIMIGTPIAAVFFVLIAYGWAAMNFWMMFAFLTIFNVAMAFYRAPVVALMPDLVPSQHRTLANGVINFMGGVGAIYAFAIASQIYKIQDPGLASLFGVGVNQIGPVLTFLTTAVIMIVAVLILYATVKEPPIPPSDSQEPKEIGIIQAFRQVSISKDRSALGILGAIFFWFLGYNAIETWFTKYGKEVLLFTTANSSFLLNGIAVSFIIFAIPAGFLGKKVGRRKTIMTGLVIMIASMLVLWFMKSYWIIFGVLAVAGLGWAFVNVNSIVMVWEQVGKARLGAGTGLYYAFSTSAAIAGPLLAGYVFDLTTIALLFPFSTIFMVVALLLTMAVRTGEMGDEAKSEYAQ